MLCCRPLPTPPVRLTIVRRFTRSMTCSSSAGGAGNLISSPCPTRKPGRAEPEMRVEIDHREPRARDPRRRHLRACSAAESLSGRGRPVRPGEDSRAAGRPGRRPAPEARPRTSRAIDGGSFEYTLLHGRMLCTAARLGLSTGTKDSASSGPGSTRLTRHQEYVTLCVSGTRHALESTPAHAMKFKTTIVAFLLCAVVATAQNRPESAVRPKSEPAVRSSWTCSRAPIFPGAPVRS